MAISGAVLFRVLILDSQKEERCCLSSPRCAPVRVTCETRGKPGNSVPPRRQQMMQRENISSISESSNSPASWLLSCSSARCKKNGRQRSPAPVNSLCNFSCLYS
ncbi:hypothetical protein SLE2022_111950 [Rubroshorea leprosula]